MPLATLFVILFLLVIAYHIWKHRLIYFSYNDRDERQRLIIGKNYQYVMATSWGLILIFLLINAVFPHLLSLPFVLASLYFLPLTVFNALNIVYDAYFPVKETSRHKSVTPKQGILGSFIIALICLYFLFFDSNASAEFFAKSGKASIFLVLMMNVMLGVAFSIKWLKDKKVGDE